MDANRISETEEMLREVLNIFHSPEIAMTRFAQTACRIASLVKANNSHTIDVCRSVLLQALEQLEAEYPESGSILRLQYIELYMVREVMQELGLHIGEAHYHNRRNKAITRLAEIIIKDEDSLIRERHKQMNAILPSPTYSRLFGVERHLNQLKEWLYDQNDHWLIMVSGMGGVGKTAIVRESIKHLGEQNCYFENVVWATAQRSSFFRHSPAGRELDLTLEQLLDTIVTQLGYPDMRHRTFETKLRDIRAILKSTPYLIVFDNLETADDVAPIAEVLNDIGNPTKVLMTSRIRLEHVDSITELTLEGLSKSDTIAFAKYCVQHQANMTLKDDPELHEKLYEVTRGNPLAITLVIGQLHTHELDILLDNLLERRGKKNDEFYRYIYEPIWESLLQENKDAGTLLAQMAHLLPPEGGKRAALQAMSALDETTFTNALDELVRFSLVYVSRNRSPYLYALHPLTRSFAASVGT